MTNDIRDGNRDVEPFFTLRDAAALLNLRYWHLLRMAKRGELRLYKAGSGRNRVRISELVAAITRNAVEQPGKGGR